MHSGYNEYSVRIEATGGDEVLAAFLNRQGWPSPLPFGAFSADPFSRRAKLLNSTLTTRQAAKQKARQAITSRACDFGPLSRRDYQFLMSSSVCSRASGPIDHRSKSGFFGL
jgi:uncharacterized protein YgbK (DUF1537 family)